MLRAKMEMMLPRPTLRPPGERDFLRSIGDALRFAVLWAPERLIRRLCPPLVMLLIGVLAAPVMILLVLLTFIIECAAVIVVGLSGRLTLREH